MRGKDAGEQIMTVYRIGFRFEPGVKRMGGRAKGGALYRQKFGVWRAVKLLEPGMDLTPVFVDEGTLYVLSADPVLPGSFKSPRVALEKYFDNRISK